MFLNSVSDRNKYVLPLAPEGVPFPIAQVVVVEGRMLCSLAHFPVEVMLVEWEPEGSDVQLCTFRRGLSKSIRRGNIFPQSEHNAQEYALLLVLPENIV